MKKSLIVIVTTFIAALFIFSACNTDTQGPKIYLYGTDGKVTQKEDTTVLLYTKFVDPGVYVEDNATKNSNIIIEDNASEELPLNSSGYLKKAEQAEITYTAKDEAGNVSEKKRIVNIYNVAQPFVRSYTTTRTTFNLNNDTSYSSNVTADSKIPGRLRFPKVYAHAWDGDRTYFRVNADLYDPIGISDVYSEEIGYMGTASNSDIPFFVNMTYEEAADEILTVKLLKIDAQQYQDTAENHSVSIQGVTQEGTGIPLSRIEYIGDSKTISKIVLELNVSKEGESPDRVTEIYIPIDQ